MITIPPSPGRLSPPGKMPRAILANSIVTLLAPLLAALGSLVLASSARASVIVFDTAGTVTEVLGAANDMSTIAPTASGSNLLFTGTGLIPVNFPSVTKINLNFTTPNQVVTFDTTAFSLSLPVVITSGSGASSDAVIKIGANTLSMTGTNNYGGGTAISGGVVSINNGGALGTGGVDLNNGGSLLGKANLALANQVTVASGGGTISAAAGTTLQMSNLNLSAANLTFGSAGNTGVVQLNTGPASVSNLDNIDVAFGTLRDGGALGAYTSVVSATTVHAGATLDLHDHSITVQKLQGAGAVTLGSNAATVLTLDAGIFSGVISGAGQLIKDNPGTLILSGANTYTGGTTISAGSLVIGEVGTTGSIAGNVIDNASLGFNRSNSLTFAGKISGTGTVSQIGNARLTLTGVNTYAGGTTIESGSVGISNGSALGTGTVTLFSGGSLIGTASLTLANQVNVTSGGGAISAAAGATLQMSNLNLGGVNLIFGSSGNTGVVQLNNGIYSVSSGDSIDVAFGTLRDGGQLNVSTSQVSATTVHAGATLDAHDHSITVKNLQGAGAVTLGSNAVTVLTLDAGTFSGVVSGAGQVTTAGTLTLSGTNTYTGGTTISTGSLQIGIGGTTGSIAGNVINSGTLSFDRSTALTFAGKISGIGTVTQNGTGLLTLTGVSNYTGGTTIGSGGVSINNGSALGTGPVTLLSGSSLLGTANLTLSNTPALNSSATATIAAAGSTALTLGSLSINANAHAVFGSAGHAGAVVIGPFTAGNSVAPSGTIEVAFGTLRNGVGGDSNGLSLFTQNVASTTVDAGATLDVHDFGMEVANLLGAGAVTLGSNAATVLIVDTGAFSGVISGKGQLTKATAGALVLSGANTYTGGTTISAGSLQIGTGGATGALAGNVTDNGGLSFDRNNALTIAGKISGSGTVTQAGSGVLTLSGVNTYTGGTSINAGVVAINNASALGTGAVTLAAGTELRSTGTVTLVNPINFSGDGPATLSTNGTLNVGSLAMLATAPNVIFGSAGNAGVVVVSGAGTAKAAAAMDVAFGTLRNGGDLGFYTSFVSSTTVHAGATLNINDFSTFVNNLQGAGAVTLGSNAATVLTLFGGTFSGVISGAGQLTKNLASTVVLSGANTYTGGTTISAGSLQIGNGGTTGAIAGNVTDNGGLSFDRNNALTFAGKISGSGTVTQAGSGVLTLSGVNTYTGGTSINAGVVAINSASALGTGAVTLAAGTELRSTGTVTLVNPINFSGDGPATLSTNGTLNVGSLSMVAASPNVIFGSAGNAGVVVVSGAGTAKAAAAMDVAFGTLRNGGDLGFYTSFISSTTVHAGATLSINDFSTFVNNLQGAGAVTLGSNASTVLTLFGGTFSGVISGAGQLTKSVNSTVALSGANTYSGGTTVNAGTLLAKNTVGSATGTGPVTVNSTGTLGGSGKIGGQITLNSGGAIAPGAGSPGVAGTTLHAPSLIWNGGGTLSLQLGSTKDELVLSGALSKGTAGAYTVNLIDAGLTQSTYTLATFASTTFAVSDFTLELPPGATGSLVETSTSLSVNVTHAEMPQVEVVNGGAVIRSGDFAGTSSESMAPGQLSVVPAPEPGSAALLALGTGALLGWRRRQRASAVARS